MNIEAKKFKIEMTYSELWNVMWDNKNALLYSVKTHWVNYQNTWREHERERLARLKGFAVALGRPDIFDNTLEDVEEEFKKFNDSKQA